MIQRLQHELGILILIHASSKTGEEAWIRS